MVVAETGEREREGLGEGGRGLSSHLHLLFSISILLQKNLAKMCNRSQYVFCIMLHRQKKFGANKIIGDFKKRKGLTRAKLNTVLFI